MNGPLITVLMPVYNAEKYIREAIDSILNQSLTDFDFLIIDDGSTDASVEIIKSYPDPRISLLQNEKNLGISASLNLGIQMAKTELIARMDADDISYPERLQMQYDYFETNPDCALLSASARVVNANKQVIRVDKYSPEYYYYNLNFICWIYHPTVMYKRSAVIAAGGYSETYSEDFDLWWQIARKYKIVHSPEVLLDYRLTNESLSAVLKKDEYEIAQHKQVLRNIRYYTGARFELSFEEVECYRFNFDPLLKKGNVAAIIQAVRKLQYISGYILAKPNVNLDRKAVEEAFQFKKGFTLQFFLKNLPVSKKIELQIRNFF